jgi:uncharacterized protein
MSHAIASDSPPGETDLRKLLAGLAPVLLPRPRTIRSLAPSVPAPADAIMLFREDEAITVIAESDIDFDHGNGIDAACETPWAQITLRIHSSLEAVGMMAAISAALARRGIPCNAVSAYFHDHLFVPWTRREDAITALAELSSESQP